MECQDPLPEDHTRPSLRDLLQSVDWLRRLARSLVSSEDLQDDLVQEVRMVGLTSSTADSVQHPPAWLRRVAQTKLRNLIRNRATRKRHERRTPPSSDTPLAPSELLSINETRKIVTAAVLELPELYRDTLLALYYADCSIKTIAETIGCTESAIRSRHKRALQLLRDALIARVDALGLATHETATRPAAAETATGKLLVVCASSGSAVAGAQVYTWSLTDEARFHTTGRAGSALDYLMLRHARPVLVATTDTKGSAQIPLAILRAQVIRIVHDSFVAHHDHPRYRALRARSLTVALDLPFPVSIHVANEAGSAVPSCTFLTAGPQRAAVQGVTNDTGTATVQWSDSAHTVSVETGEHLPYRRLLRAPHHRVDLRPGRPLTIRAVDADAAPVAGCQVLMHISSWSGWYHCGRTSADGMTATPPVVSDGSYWVRVQHPDYVHRQERIRFSSEAAEITLERGIRVRGQVLLPSGSPCEGGHISIYNKHVKPHAAAPPTTRIDDSGQFDIGSHNQGTVELLVSISDELSQTFTIDLNGVTDLELVTNLQLGATTTVSGRVVDTKGRGLSGVALRVGPVLGDDVAGPSTTSASDGTFCVRHAPRTGSLTSAHDQWDPRWWSALNELGEMDESALVLEVLRPFELMSKNNTSVSSFALRGSINTCTIRPGETDVVLTIADPAQTTLRFGLRDPDGHVIRSLTYITFSTTDGYNNEELCDVMGTPIRAFRPQRASGQSAIVQVEGYSWAHVELPERPQTRIDVELTPCRNAPLAIHYCDSDGTPYEGCQLLVARVDRDGNPGVVAFLGTTDSDGNLLTRALCDGTYAVYGTRLPQALQARLSRSQVANPRSLWHRWDSQDDLKRICGQIDARLSSVRVSCSCPRSLAPLPRSVAESTQRSEPSSP